MRHAHKLPILCVTLATIVAINIRAPDTFLFDVAVQLAIGSSTTLVIFALINILLSILAFARPLTGATLAILLFALVKGRADSVVSPSLSCGSGRLCLAVVTGANSGIGLATAKLFAAQGHHVILGCRSRKACETAMAKIKQTTGSDERVRAAGGLDLASLGAVQQWVNDLVLDQPIDYLINNAGLVPVGNTTTAEGFEVGFGVSYLGHFALFRWLLLKGSIVPSTTIVTVASDAARLGALHDSLQVLDGEGDLRGEVTVGCNSPFPFCVPPMPGSHLHQPPTPFNFGAYPRAKLSNVLFARALSNQSLSGLEVAYASSSVHPGMVETRMAGQIAEPFAWLGGVRIQTDAMQMATMRFLLRPADVAANVVANAAAAAKRSKGHGPFCNGMGEPIPDTLLSAALRDDQTARRLWQVSLALVQQWERRK
jgi:NAD(P)-dependent dehydrogenase (short-subunit alcohol dehydrogenase family)